MNLNRSGAGRHLINQVLLKTNPRVTAHTATQSAPTPAERARPKDARTPRSKFSARTK